MSNLLFFCLYIIRQFAVSDCFAFISCAFALFSIARLLKYIISLRKGGEY